MEKILTDSLMKAMQQQGVRVEAGADGKARVNINEKGDNETQSAPVTCGDVGQRALSTKGVLAVEGLDGSTMYYRGSGGRIYQSRLHETWGAVEKHALYLNTWLLK